LLAKGFVAKVSPCRTPKGVYPRRRPKATSCSLERR